MITATTAAGGLSDYFRYYNNNQISMERKLYGCFFASWIKNIRIEKHTLRPYMLYVHVYVYRVGNSREVKPAAVTDNE